MPLSRFLRILGSLAAMALIATACGGDDQAESGTGTTPADTDETVSPAEASEPSSPSESSADAGETVEVTGIDYAYEDVPATVAAGTTLTLTNASEAELHELVAMRLPDDEDRPVDELIQLPEEELGALFGGPPAMVLLAPPGEAPQIAAVGTGTLTEPGRYLLFCAIPIGADPAEYLAAAESSGGGPPEVEGGPPHFTEGMYAETTVE
jgi:plastocyanin